MYAGYAGSFITVIHLAIIGSSIRFYPAVYKPYKYPSGDYYSNNGLIFCRNGWAHPYGFLNGEHAIQFARNHSKLPFLVGGVSIVKKVPVIPEFFEFEQKAVERLRAA